MFSQPCVLTKKSKNITMETLEAVMFCIQCGHNIGEGVNFCKKCGKGVPHRMPVTPANDVNSVNRLPLNENEIRASALFKMAKIVFILAPVIFIVYLLFFWNLPMVVPLDLIYRRPAPFLLWLAFYVIFGFSAFYLIINLILSCKSKKTAFTVLSIIGMAVFVITLFLFFSISLGLYGTIIAIEAVTVIHLSRLFGTYIGLRTAIFVLYILFLLVFSILVLVWTFRKTKTQEG